MQGWNGIKNYLKDRQDIIILSERFSNEPGVKFETNLIKKT